ncbi:MAG: hypothetical protein HW395_591, partial [candidate division NC10 bacterium]|nr:hypothetical protein [candidate division NC10 bacterium]
MEYSPAAQPEVEGFDGLWKIEAPAQAVRPDENQRCGATVFECQLEGFQERADASPREDRPNENQVILVETKSVFHIFHGLAGSSHLFGVLPALAFPSRQASMLYLAGFGLGAIA